MQSDENYFTFLVSFVSSPLSLFLQCSPTRLEQRCLFFLLRSANLSTTPLSSSQKICSCCSVFFLSHHHFSLSTGLLLLACNYALAIFV